MNRSLKSARSESSTYLTSSSSARPPARSRRLSSAIFAPSPALEAGADRIAGMFGLPLTRVDVGVSRLEQALGEIL